MLFGSGLGRVCPHNRVPILAWELDALKSIMQLSIAVAWTGVIDQQQLGQCSGHRVGRHDGESGRD